MYIHGHHSQQKGLCQQDLVGIFEGFCRLLIQPDVGIDNALTHQGKPFQEKGKQWDQQDLYVLFASLLARLNRIELQWKIRYE